MGDVGELWVLGAGASCCGRQCAAPPTQPSQGPRQVACHMCRAFLASWRCCEWFKMAGGQVPVAGSCLVQGRQEVLSPSSEWQLRHGLFREVRLPRLHLGISVSLVTCTHCRSGCKHKCGHNQHLFSMSADLAAFVHLFVLSLLSYDFKEIYNSDNCRQYFGDWFPSWFPPFYSKTPTPVHKFKGR